MRVKTAIIVFPGSNCDRDVAVILETVTGIKPIMVWHRETTLPSVDLIVIPGGFSYGDYLRCGAMAAKSPIMQDVIKKAKEGIFILGICNGFQILTEAELLPGVLIRNKNLTYICKDVYLSVEQKDTAFTSGYKEAHPVVIFPIAHAEGHYFASPQDLEKIEKDQRVIFRYCDEKGLVSEASNPNGSCHHIAGIVSENRRILGLMPHPERRADQAVGGIDGLILFQSLMEAC
jgi:phosphoribosylformylglycinamidine synthase